MHALIIEDEALIGMAIQDALRDIGYASFDFAVSMDEAVEAAERRCPDIITADVQLAPGNGIDAVVSICSAKAIPVIFITATGHEVKARLPGKIVVGKPFSAEEIKGAVRLVLQPA
jgi:DNA-binding response OmpR family regulator